MLVQVAGEQIRNRRRRAVGVALAHGIFAARDRLPQLGGTISSSGNLPAREGSESDPALPAVDSIVENESAGTPRGDTDTETFEVVVIDDPVARRRQQQLSHQLLSTPCPPRVGTRTQCCGLGAVAERL